MSYKTTIHGDPMCVILKTVKAIMYLLYVYNRNTQSSKVLNSALPEQIFVNLCHAKLQFMVVKCIKFPGVILKTIEVV